MRRVQLRVCVGFVFVAWLSVVLLTAETEPAGLSEFGEFPQTIVMHRFKIGEKRAHLWPSPELLKEQSVPESPGTARARRHAEEYLRLIVKPDLLPPNLQERFVLRRLGKPESPCNVIDLRYRVDDLAIWAHQTSTELVVRTQVVGLKPIAVPPVPVHDCHRAVREPAWQDWRTPAHNSVLDLTLAVAETLFVRQGEVPKAIEIREGPWPAGFGGLSVRLSGAPGNPWDVVYWNEDRLGRLGRAFADFGATTDGQTVVFTFYKFAGRSSWPSGPGKWFSEDTREHTARTPIEDLRRIGIVEDRDQ